MTKLLLENLPIDEKSKFTEATVKKVEALIAESVKSNNSDQSINKQIYQLIELLEQNGEKELAKTLIDKYKAELAKTLTPEPELLPV